ncbi:MAG TPA: acyl carrier protein, partial [Thermoanaerobaculia bacterium]
LAALGRFLCQGQPQIGVMKIDWRLLGDSFPQIARMPWGRALFAGKEIGKEIEKDPEKGSGREGELGNLLTRPAAERPALLREYLLRVIARSLRLPPERVDESRSITTLGLDSLVALELRNRIQADVKVAVPIVKLLQGPSIAGLAEYLAGQLESPGSLPGTLRTASPAPAPPSAEDAQDLVDAMSDAEVDAMLQRLATSRAPRNPAHG